jgi:hypothetical protein
MRLRALAFATLALMALASGTTSALAVDRHPDKPSSQLGIREKVHLPIYDAIFV